MQDVASQELCSGNLWAHLCRRNHARCLECHAQGYLLELARFVQEQALQQWLAFDGLLSSGSSPAPALSLAAGQEESLVDHISAEQDVCTGLASLGASSIRLGNGLLACEQAHSACADDEMPAPATEIVFGSQHTALAIRTKAGSDCPFPSPHVAQSRPMTTSPLARVPSRDLPLCFLIIFYEASSEGTT